MELLMQKCVSTAETARKQWQSTNESVNDMGSQHVLAMHSVVRNMCDISEQHVTEFDSTKDAAEEVVTRNSEDAIQSFEGLSEKERASISGILDTANTHSETLGVFERDHTSQCTSIEQKAIETFQQRYMDYEPTGSTPIRSEPDVPSKGTIESLRAMPMESLQEEFRENNSFKSFKVKEVKTSLIPRSPLTQINH